MKWNSLKFLLVIGFVFSITGCKEVEKKQIIVEVPNLLNQDKFKKDVENLENK